MKIGIKYCGGCNPRYDRKKFIEDIKKTFGDVYDFQLANQDTEYDALLIMGGCGNCCADYSGIKTKYDPFLVKAKEDYDKVIVWLKKIKYKRKDDIDELA